MRFRDRLKENLKLYDEMTNNLDEAYKYLEELKNRKNRELAQRNMQWLNEVVRDLDKDLEEISRENERINEFLLRLKDRIEELRKERKK